MFLQGMVKVQQGYISAGLKDLEAAAWNGHHAGWVTNETIAVVLTLLPEHPEAIFPLQTVKATCESLAARSKIPSVGLPMFPTITELLELPKIHWEELFVPGLNTRATRKYEQSVTGQVKEGKLTEHEAALAYIDYCLACQHPAEIAVCFLSASLWFLRELQKRASKTTTNS